MAKSVDELIKALEAQAAGQEPLDDADLELAAELQRELASEDYDEDDPKALRKALKRCQERLVKADEDEDEGEVPPPKKARRRPVEEEEDETKEEEDEEAPDEEAPDEDIPPLPRRKLSKSPSGADEDDEGGEDEAFDPAALQSELEELADVVDVGPAIREIAKCLKALSKAVVQIASYQSEQARDLNNIEKSLTLVQAQQPKDLKTALAEALEKSAAKGFADHFREMKDRQEALEREVEGVRDAVDSTVVSRHPSLHKAVAAQGAFTQSRAIAVLRKSLDAKELDRDQFRQAMWSLREGTEPMAVVRQALAEHPQKLDGLLRTLD